MENLEKLIYDLYKKSARQCTNEEIILRQYSINLIFAVLVYIRKRSSLADIYNYISSQLKKIQQNCDFMTGFCETCEETFRLPAGIS